jgi:uncharacterized protein YggE
MSESRSTAVALTLALALALAGAGGSARGQFYNGNPGGGSENIEGFTVAGKGSVSAKPNVVEVDLEVAAASELTADAIVKYRDARRRLRDAFAALKLPNVAVDERGLLVDQKGQQNNYYWGPFQQNARTKTEVQLTRKLVVKGSDLRKMDEDGVLQLVAKLLDVAQDAGAKVGSQPNYRRYYYYDMDNTNPGLVRFVVDDIEALQEQAYEKAIADARARAARLAKLSGVGLGPVVAVRELSVPGERHQPDGDEETPRKRLESSKFQAIPVRVELLVRFSIRPKPEGQAQAQGRTGQ